MKLLNQPGFLETTSRHGGRFAAVILAVTVTGLAGVARGQTFVEYPIPTAGSAPSDIAPGPDGNLWFTETQTNKIGRMTTSGVVTEFAIPTANGQPAAIIAGADGNLWFTESYDDAAGFLGKIGRITTAGVITEYPLTVSVISPQGIAAGPDGNLWFTEYFGSRIGRITTAGVVTEFAVPLGSAPSAIAVGSDGNLWFTEYFGRKIGRITTAGVITEFSIPTPYNQAAGIAAGPDGALWFTEVIFPPPDTGPLFGKIGRITTAGAVTEFAIPTTFGLPKQITAGPDGALWFTGDGGEIGRITPAGLITEFPAPGRGFLQGIATGPDGAVWFTDVSANKIGRLGLSGTCAPSATSLCLNNARFKVEAAWFTNDGMSGNGQAVVLTSDAGYFWFFSANNPEVVVKGLSGCAFNNHQWLFASGLTNVNVALKVTDAQTGQVKTYTNPQGTAFQPIQETSAFACP